MNKYLRPLGRLLLAAPLLLVACDKEDTGELEGGVPDPGFTVTLDTSKFPTIATFTNTSTNGFLAQWDFGDGSGLLTAPGAVHAYKRTGSFSARLILAGRGGTGTSTGQTVNIPDACDYPSFVGLTGCATGTNRAWTISTQAGAITVLDAAGAEISSSAAGALPTCRTDDEFTFTSTFGYAYASNGGTYRDDSCRTALDGSSDFTFEPTPAGGGLPRITLLRPNAFIGLPDSVVDKTYEIVQADATTLKLQGTNPDGTRTVITYKPQLSSLDRAKLLLTGGSSKAWTLDNTVDFPITVGVETNPTRDYGGASAGALPACQADDEFTFSTANVYTYDPKAETFVGGGVYACQAPRPATTPFSYGPAVGAGIAQFVLSTPGTFIGVTDAPTDRVYRIMSITTTNLVLRAGGPNGQIFTLKLRAR